MKANRDYQKLFQGKLKADVVFKNVHYLDVFSACFRQGDISIYGGKIVALHAMDADEVLDGQGKYIAPLLVDAHMHIESTTVLPSQLESLLVPRGVGTLIVDPHEIANVAGNAGFQFMLDASEGLDLDVRLMYPSSVPCLVSEHAGAVLKADDLKVYLNHPKVNGLAEVMDKPSVLSDEDMLDKLQATQSSGKVCDGHGANLRAEDADLYAAMGILTDHEATSLEEAEERLKRGFWIHLREGSVTKNLEALMPLVTALNFRRFSFCTDDMHPDDVYEHGGVDAVVRKAIKLGMDPAMAFTIGSYHPALCYQLEDEGAIAPGYHANFFVMDNLEDLKVESVYRDGRCIAENGKLIKEGRTELKVPEALLHSIHLPDLESINFDLIINTSKSRVLNVEAGNVLTPLSIESIHRDDRNVYQPSIRDDLAKLTVLQRHDGSGRFAQCPVKGFRLKSGAIASSVAHDSHNLVIASMNDDDLKVAIKALVVMGGGFVVADQGEVKATLPLEIAGLMTQKDLKDSLEDWDHLHEAFHQISDERGYNPFLMLSFLALPVIPFVKLTDTGLVDVMTQETLSLEA